MRNATKTVYGEGALGGTHFTDGGVVGMEEYNKEYCRKCGLEVFPFSRKYSVSMGEYFCVKCAEKVDREYILKNSCSVCRKMFGRNDARMVLPSKVYNEDRRLLISDRLVCAPCFKAMGMKVRDRITFTSKVNGLRQQIRRSLAKKMLQQPEPQEMKAS